MLCFIWCAVVLTTAAVSAATEQRLAIVRTDPKVSAISADNAVAELCAPTAAPLEFLPPEENRKGRHYLARNLLVERLSRRNCRDFIRHDSEAEKYELMLIRADALGWCGDALDVLASAVTVCAPGSRGALVNDADSFAVAASTACWPRNLPQPQFRLVGLAQGTLTVGGSITSALHAHGLVRVLLAAEADAVRKLELAACHITATAAAALGRGFAVLRLAERLPPALMLASVMETHASTAAALLRAAMSHGVLDVTLLSQSGVTGLELAVTRERHPVLERPYVLQRLHMQGAGATASRVQRILRALRIGHGIVLQELVIERADASMAQQFRIVAPELRGIEAVALRSCRLQTSALHVLADALMGYHRLRSLDLRGNAQRRGPKTVQALSVLLLDRDAGIERLDVSHGTLVDADLVSLAAVLVEQRAQRRRGARLAALVVNGCVHGDAPGLAALRAVPDLQLTVVRREPGLRSAL